MRVVGAGVAGHRRRWGVQALFPCSLLGCGEPNEWLLLSPASEATVAEVAAAAGVAAFWCCSHSRPGNPGSAPVHWTGPSLPHSPYLRPHPHSHIPNRHTHTRAHPCVPCADDGGGMKLTAQARTALMSRLATNAGLAPPVLPPAFNPMAQPQMPAQPQVRSRRAAQGNAAQQGIWNGWPWRVLPLLLLGGALPVCFALQDTRSTPGLYSEIKRWQDTRRCFRCRCRPLCSWSRGSWAQPRPSPRSACC